MNNNNGFTLVELLVMLVVLSILITITVPNIMGIVNENKENTLIDDAGKMLDSAKVKTAIDKDLLPTSENNCSIIRLNFADKNDDINFGPHDGKYDRQNSFVVIKFIQQENGNYKYQYYARIVEVKDDDVYGIKIATAEDIESRKKTVLINEPSLNDINDIYNITTNDLRKLNIDCSHIIQDKRF